MSPKKKATPSEQKESKPPNALVEWLKTGVFVFVFYFIFTWLVAEAFFIPSGSMEGTLHEGTKLTADRILVAKGLVFKMMGIDRGDVIVFRSKESKPEAFWRRFILWRDDKPEMIVKRVVGLPGEHVSLKGGQLHINNEPVSDPDVFKEIQYIPDGHLRDNGVEVPPGHYLVLGDNSGNSRDGRHWGFLPQENTAGVAMFRFWPPLRIGPLTYQTPPKN